MGLTTKLLGLTVFYLHTHLWLQQVPHFRAYAVPSLSDGVAMDSLIHIIPAEDDVAELPVQRRKGRKYGSNEFENTSKTRWSMRL